MKPARPRETPTARRAGDVESFTRLAPAAPSSFAKSLRALAAWEIVSVAVSALIAVWLVPALAGNNSPAALLPIGFAFAFMLISRRAHGETARDLGLRIDNFAPAARFLLPPTLTITFVLLLSGWLGGTINFQRWRAGASGVGLAALGLAWGFVQQYALQGFVNRRAQTLCGKGPRSVLLVAGLFALIHLPNPALAVVTFAGGALWAAAYQREPNLWALTLSHSLLTLVLISTVPPSLLNGLRVGYKFFGLFI